jgi:serine/threonine protein kinase
MLVIMAAVETVRVSRTPFGATTGPESPEIDLPCQLGSVRLEREIGRGGMGVVWRGYDEVLRRPVAVKFMLTASASTDDPGFAAFIGGAQAAAAVRHDALTTVFHAATIKGVPYLVMDFIDGPSLDDVARARGPLSLPAVLAVMEAVCAGINEVHEHGLLHRDIKPANIMLDSGGAVRITDFGIACERPAALFGAPGGSAAIAGTPQFMAPEAFDGILSARTDVYAIGITAFTLLAGTAPFSGSLTGLREKHRSEPLPLAILTEKGVPPAVIDVIDRAVRKEPLFRYKSAVAFFAALREACTEPSLWASGRMELRSLAGAWCAGATATKDRSPADAGRAPDASSADYYRHLSHRAQTRRRDEPDRLTESAPSPMRTPPGTILVELPCAFCGYSLRGLLAGGSCPECSNPLGVSTDPRRLEFAPAAWLRRTARGLYLSNLVIVIGLLAQLVAVALIAGLRVSPPIWMVVVGVLGIFLLVTYLTAAFLATTREPQADSDPPVSKRAKRTDTFLRWSIRISAVVGMLAPIPPAILANASETLVGDVASGLAALCFVAASSLWARRLARRIPDAKLSRRCTFALVLTLSLPLFLVAVSITSLLGPAMEAVASIALWVLLVGLVVLVIDLVSVCAGLSRTLLEISKRAVPHSKAFAPTAS